MLMRWQLPSEARKANSELCYTVALGISAAAQLVATLQNPAVAIYSAAMKVGSFLYSTPCIKI